ncbi:MAG: cysteine methyltransferase [Frankiales bacterium]|nr:cysteine methyltransferase [Frankiales bacterium]
MRSHTVVDSPVGPLTLVDDDALLAGVWMTDQNHRPPVELAGPRDDDVQPSLREQLEAYWVGELREFDVPMVAQGTPFQQTVWAALRRIPYGQTWSYGRLASEIGRPTASRAVGMANGRNPVGIVVPCHRVIGSTGSMIGYGGGLDRKRFLLALEAGAIAL